MILINGQPETTLSVADRGLQYGDGLFETIPFRDGKLEYLNEHIERLLRGCARLHIDFTDLESLERELVMLCAQTSEDKVIKIIITRGSGGRGYKPPKDTFPQRIIASYPLPDYPVHNSQGVTVQLCTTRLSANPLLAGIKHLNRLEQVIARNEWDSGEIAEGLMLNYDDELIEGTMSNVFLVRDSRLFTPDLRDSGIEGIMRRQIIEHASTLDIPHEVVSLNIDDLYQADEVFISNSLIGIWPVTLLHGTNKQWPHGDLTKKLQKALSTANIQYEK